jgi:hypothetical protein
MICTWQLVGITWMWTAYWRSPIMNGRSEDCLFQLCNSKCWHDLDRSRVTRLLWIEIGRLEWITMIWSIYSKLRRLGKDKQSGTLSHSVKFHEKISEFRHFDIWTFAGRCHSQSN